METDFVLLKADDDKRLVFGFFNINKVDGELIEDRQGDLIETEEMEKSAYGFVLNARVAGEGHVRKGVGSLVESFMITKEKQEAIVKTLKDSGVKNPVMDLGVEGWWGGFYIEDDKVWKKIKKGEYPMFSIGGNGKRTPVEEK